MTGGAIRAARWISIVAHPFVMIGALVGVSGFHRGSRGPALESLLIVAAAVIVPLAILMFVQVRRRRWGNADASDPAERPLLFIVALGGLAAMVGWMAISDPASHLVRGALVIGTFLLASFLLTRWVKLSLHVAFAALAATALSLLGSRVGWILAGVVPLLAWSRLSLARHRPVEIAVGLILGIMTGYALVAL